MPLMKSHLLPLAALAAAFTFPLAAQEEAEKEVVETPKLIRVQVEYVDLPLATVSNLLFEDDSAQSDATALRNKVQELVKKGEGKIMETLVATGRSGEKQTSESIQEMIYPTEYEPAEVPSEVDIPDKPGGLTPEDILALDMLVTPATPTSFETRNVGSTLEIEPALGEDAKTIDLKLAPSLVWFTGNETWGEHKSRSGNVSRIEMPVFYSIHLSTALTLIDGKPALAAVVSPKDDKGKIDFSRKLMIFVKARVQEVK